MSAHDTDRIGSLTFDFALPASSHDSLALADWVRDALLPVIEDALDQSRSAARRRRIGRLEIDLGTVAAANARSELPRRLFAALSDALEQAASEPLAAQETAEPGQAMLSFLRSGQLAWPTALDAIDIHKKLLRPLLDSPQAPQVFNAAVQEPHMLTRLIRQFDSPQLLEVAGVLLAAWAPDERSAALAWIGRQAQELGDAAEPFWRWVFAQAEHAVSAATLETRWQEGGDAQLRDGPFTPSELDAIGRGLAGADFALLAPYWDRILSCAPHLIRSAANQSWPQWLRRFDDATLADLLGALQADCGWLIEQLAPVLPRPQLGALLRPAMRQWLAVPVDSLAPGVVLAWVKASAPRQRGRIDALFDAQARTEPHSGRGSAQLLEAARVLFDAWPQVQRDDAIARAGAELQRLEEAGADSALFWHWLWEHHARGGDAAAAPRLTPDQREALASAGFARAHIGAIAQALAAGRYALLAPYWTRLQSCAPTWLARLNDDALADMACAIHQDCAQLIDALATRVPHAQRATHWTPALRDWLATPAGVLRPDQVVAWAVAALPEQADRIRALAAAPVVEAPQQATRAMQRTDARMLGAAEILFAAWPQAPRMQALAWAQDEVHRLRDAGGDTAAFWRWLLPAHALHAGVDALRQAWAAIAQNAQALGGPQSTPAAPEPDGATQWLAAARVLFGTWPDAERAALLAWAGEQLRRLDGAQLPSFGRWLLARPEQGGKAAQVAQDYAVWVDRGTAGQAGPNAGLAPGERLILASPIRHADAQSSHVAQDGPKAAPASGEGTAPADQIRHADAQGSNAAQVAQRNPTRVDRGAMDQAGRRAVQIDAGPGADGFADQLRAAQGDRPAFAGLVRHADAQRLLAATLILFQDWPDAEREGVLAWASDVVYHRRETGSQTEAFWCWLLAQHAQPTTLSILVTEYTKHARPGGQAAVAAPDSLLTASFTAEEAAAIEQGVARAQFDLLAPHWERLRTAAPAWICARHPHCWRTWVARFDDEVLLDILAVVQAECAPLMARIGAVMPRARLLASVRPSLAEWIGTAPQRLSPGVVLMELMKNAPEHADALAALYYGDQPASVPAAGAVDSRHYREPLQVLGSLFARSDIITISKALNAGQFEPLVPHWDRLLVLAPHWLRSEYPRLARTWLAGFDDEVLIDILSVAQADCCALIERLAAALPREQFHAALRPSLPHWFTLALDRLAPHSIMDEIVRAIPGKAAQLRSLLEDAAPAGASRGDGAWLESALRQGDVDQLERHWPALMIGQRDQLRRTWAQLADAERVATIDAIFNRLSLFRQAEIAAIVQPGAAILLAELQRVPVAQERAALLRCALQLLLHADVASILPDRLVAHLLAHGHALAGAARHTAALLQAITPEPDKRDHAWEAAHSSVEELRACLVRCLSEDAQFGQRDSAQLHRLLQTWARFQQADDGGAAFLQIVEARAVQADRPHAFFARVLRQAVLGQTIDLDAIAAACESPAPTPHKAPADVAPAREEHRENPPAARHAALPDAVSRTLPRRLADAMLRADLSELDGQWPAIVVHAPGLLAQAAQRYLGRADTRNRFIGSADAGKTLDILRAVVPAYADLIAPLLEGAAVFGAMLPMPLTPAAFEQRVLRCAFAQAMAHQQTAVPDACLAGVLEAVLATQAHRPDPAQRALLAHAWHEALRGRAALPLSAALERSLFGVPCQALAQRRLRTATQEAGPAQPDKLLRMPMMALCERYPELTDHLLADGALACVPPATFSAAEWQALARAQMPRQELAVQQAFWREFSANTPVQDSAGLQKAFCAAFAVVQGPPREPASAGRVAPAAADHAASAATIALLLMRAQAPDEAATVHIGLLMQSMLADAGGAWHATLRSALRDELAIERLVNILSGPTLARLVSLLQPELTGHLPSVLRVLGEALPLTLPSVPAMMDGGLWRAVLEAMFAGAPVSGAAALLRAVAARLASRHPDGADWARRIDTLAPGTGPRTGPGPTAAQAMAGLLEPLAAVRTDKRTDKRTAQAMPCAAEALPFAGDANLGNAGLVLVAPYVERLFDLLGVTVDGDFVSEEARQRGVHLLQYVITAQESTPEHLLTLNKFLCAMPTAVPAVAGISMSDKEKDTIEQMLKGVIAHWTAIGSSSVEGLRETFLQRDGCLYCQDEAWHLKVPQRTFDMLLDRLPWGYKLIKFPWMAAPLNVTWR